MFTCFISVLSPLSLFCLSTASFDMGVMLSPEGSHHYYKFQNPSPSFQCPGLIFNILSCPTKKKFSFRIFFIIFFKDESMHRCFFLKQKQIPDFFSKPALNGRSMNAPGCIINYNKHGKLPR